MRQTKPSRPAAVKTAIEQLAALARRQVCLRPPPDRANLLFASPAANRRRSTDKEKAAGRPGVRFDALTLLQPKLPGVNPFVFVCLVA